MFALLVYGDRRPLTGSTPRTEVPLRRHLSGKYFVVARRDGGALTTFATGEQRVGSLSHLLAIDVEQGEISLVRRVHHPHRVRANGPLLFERFYDSAQSFYLFCELDPVGCFMAADGRGDGGKRGRAVRECQAERTLFSALGERNICWSSAHFVWACFVGCSNSPVAVIRLFILSTSKYVSRGSQAHTPWWNSDRLLCRGCVDCVCDGGIRYDRKRVVVLGVLRSFLSRKF